MDYKQALKWVYNLKGSEHKGGFNLSLDAVKVLLSKLGNPQDDLKVIHVTGTNGKGSVCAMIATVLKEAGYKVGLYTSPHLKDFRERFLIDGRKISKEEFTKYFEIVKPFVTDQTFFEVVTAIAFLYFNSKKVDFLVCEVGLGGRLDATNLVNPLISVITNVSLEHKAYLGSTIEKIAYEKAGIIKEKKPTVTGATGRALEVIKKIAKERNSELFAVKKPILKYPLKLQGDFQKINASIALESIKILNKNYNLKIKKNKIKKGLLNTKWPGRLEFISHNILVDCAHNPDAVRNLKKELLKIKKRFNKMYLVIGILKDKDYKDILDELVPIADKVILTKPNIPRALEPKVLAKYVKKEYVIIKDAKKALKYAKKMAKKDDLIVVTGSIYLVGEIV